MEDAKKYLEHIRKLLHEKKVSELPDELADDPLFAQICEELKAIRGITLSFSTGDFSSIIAARGFIPGCLKNLQANLRHLIWQVQMVEKGDFTQEVRFMGEFSTAFNNMVRKLRWSLEELKFLANRDSLTGVYNRRSFIEIARAGLKNAAEKSIPCCLAIMDIDYFKKFNDAHGHLAGDEALRHAVKIIGDSLRKDDFMGRYGGEEFVIFFYNADEEAGLQVAKRLRENLAENPVLLASGPVPIHASFGVAGSSTENPEDKNYVQNLINNADVALYAAKKAGRNRAMLYKGQKLSFPV
jgi:diguanylate cyclase (GGDEF)-like protein